MKKGFFASLLGAFVFMGLVACSSEVASISDEEVASVPIEVTFTGFDVSVLPDAPKKVRSRATADDAGVSRIAFKAFDIITGKEVFSTEKSKGTDVEDFNRVKCHLPVSAYTFVAVAHKAKTTESSAANIVSTTEATIFEKTLPKEVYTTVLDNVFVDKNTTKDVTINFGKRVTSTFSLNITDAASLNSKNAVPYIVKKVEIVLNPSQDQGVASAPYTLNPTTGLSPKVQTYKAEVIRPENGKFSFPIRFNFLLTSAEQTMDVVINMKDEKGEVLYTRTLQNVSFKQHRVTEAKGTFFSSDVTGSFDFDIQDDDPVTVPLYPKN